MPAAFSEDDLHTLATAPADSEDYNNSLAKLRDVTPGITAIYDAQSAAPGDEDRQVADAFSNAVDNTKQTVDSSNDVLLAANTTDGLMQQGNPSTPMEPEDPVGPEYYDTSANTRTIDFGLRHPIIATEIGLVMHDSTNISTNSVRFALNTGLPEDSSQKGTYVNAFRHALWQSTITTQYGESIAYEAGNAHEENPFAATGKNLQTSFSTLDKADETIDLLNNVIGRSIGTANPNASMQELAIKTLDYFHNNGLWTATAAPNDKDVTTISQTKLTDEQYNNSLKILKTTNNNGYTPEQQAKRDKVIEEQIFNGTP
jgi:hypothetical protein